MYYAGLDVSLKETFVCLMTVPGVGIITAKLTSTDATEPYFPKGTNFTRLTQGQVMEVEKRLNNRPRLSLNFETPAERFLSH